MNTKYRVQVRDYKVGSIYTAPMAAVIKTVERKLYGQQIGNFNPFFCRYGGRTFQVHSDAGDVSDPFRRSEEYAETFFIDVSSPCKWNL